MLSAAVVIAMFYAWAAEYVGQVAAITGAYIAGVLIAQTEFKKEIDGGVHPLAYSIFVPVFFIGIGLQANGRELGDRVALYRRCSCSSRLSPRQPGARSLPGGAASRRGSRCA